MSKKSSISISQSSLTNSTDPLFSSLIFINAAQLPLKLEPTTYTTWKAQIDALLFGYDLLGFVDATHCCPLREVTKDDKTTPNME